MESAFEAFSRVLFSNSVPVAFRRMNHLSFPVLHYAESERK